MNKVEYFTDLAKSIEKDERRMNDDTISRQAAIDAMGKAEWAKERLRALPSAQPEINCSEIPNNSDTISRQDAVSRRRLLSDLKELITAWEKYPVMAEQIKGVEVAIGYVEAIPSAQSDVPDTNVGDPISRLAAIDALIELTIQRDKWDDKEGFAQKRGIDAAICAIEDLPSAERRGRWIDAECYSEGCDDGYICSECRRITYRTMTPFCGWCGARMMDDNATQHTECVENALDALDEVKG